MKNPICTFCGSSKSTRSPSGEHFVCLGCQHVIVAKRQKKTESRRSGDDRRVRSKSLSVSQATA